MTQKETEARRRYRASRKARGLKEQKGNRKAQMQRYRAKNKDKIRARRKLQHAIDTGLLLPHEECAVCLVQDRLEAHHEDYSKPLDVVWLCVSCHNKLDNPKRGTNESEQIYKAVGVSRSYYSKHSD